MTDQPDQDSPDLAHLLEGLRQQATLVEQGSFQVNWSKALDKVQQYALEDKNRYVLEWIRGGIQSGANEVRVYTDLDDVIVQFDTMPLLEPDRDRLFESLFATGADRAALQSLAIGLVTALGMEPKFVVMQVSRPEDSWRMAFKSLAEIQIEHRDGPNPHFSGTRLWIRERFGTIHASEIIKGNPEYKLIKHHCRFSPIPVLRNNRRIRAIEKTHHVKWRPIESNGHSGVVSLLPHKGFKDLLQPRISLCVDGIVAEEIPFPGMEQADTGGLAAWIDSPLLRLDASRNKLIRDQAYTQALDLVTRESRSLLKSFVMWQSDPVDRTALQHRLAGIFNEQHQLPNGYSAQWRRSIMQLAASQFVCPDSTEDDNEGTKILLNASLLVLATVNPRHATLKRALDTFKQVGLCPIARRSYRISRSELKAYEFRWPAVFLRPRWLLNSIFSGRLQDADADLAAIAQSGVDFSTPVLATADWIAEATLESESVRGQVRLLDEAPEPYGIEIHFHRNDDPTDICGRFTLQNSEFPGLAILRSSEFDYFADQLPEQAAFQQALALVQSAGPGILEQLRAAFTNPPPPARLMDLQPVQPWFARITGHDWLIPAWRLLHSADFNARRHIDDLLATLTKYVPTPPPWVLDWPLFFFLDGTSCSLDFLKSQSQRIGVVIEQPWSLKEGRKFLNLSQQQAELLRTHGNFYGFEL